MSFQGCAPQTELTGVDNPTILSWITAAQSALNALMTGQRVVTIEVTGGGQHRQVSYRNDANSLAMLNAWIAQLQREAALRGIGQRFRPRRALGVRF